MYACLTRTHGSVCTLNAHLYAEGHQEGWIIAGCAARCYAQRLIMLCILLRLPLVFNGVQGAPLREAHNGQGYAARIRERGITQRGPPVGTQNATLTPRVPLTTYACRRCCHMLGFTSKRKQVSESRPI